MPGEAETPSGRRSADRLAALCAVSQTALLCARGLVFIVNATFSFRSKMQKWSHSWSVCGFSSHAPRTPSAAQAAPLGSFPKVSGGVSPSEPSGHPTPCAYRFRIYIIML